MRPHNAATILTHQAAAHVPQLALDRGTTPYPSPLSVCAVVISYRPGTHLLACIRSILEDEPGCEIVVVDNDPDDGACAAASKRFSEIRVLTPERNLGYAGGANFGARCTSASILLFLNPDVVLHRGCISALVQALTDTVGVAGPVLDIASLGQREYGSTLNHLGMPVGFRAHDRAPLYVSGAVLATRRDVFDAIGGFDSRYFMFVEDVEYCWRVLMTGLDVMCVASASAWHLGGSVASGGYPVAGQAYHTTPLRLIYRERNTIALFICCAPLSWLPWALPVLVARSLLLSVSALFLGMPQLAGGLLLGLVWNVTNLRTTVMRRRSLRQVPAGRHAADQRLSHTPVMVRTLLRHWPPRIVGPRTR